MAKVARYVPVRAIKVTLWERFVGAIVPHDAGYYAFEYDADFLRSGLDIAPLKMPLANGAGPYVFNDFGTNAFMGLPGVFADSLPDEFIVGDRDLPAVSDRFVIGTGPRVLKQVEEAFSSDK